jgi:acyl carrier protein
MTNEETLRRLMERYVSAAETVTLDADLYDDLGLDSFSAVEFFLAAESTIGTSLSMDDFVTIRSLRDLLTAMGA